MPPGVCFEYSSPVYMLKQIIHYEIKFLEIIFRLYTTFDPSILYFLRKGINNPKGFLNIVSIIVVIYYVYNT